MGADDNLRPRAARQVAQGWNVLSKTDHIAAGKNTTMEHYLKVVHTTYLIGSGCAPALPRRRPHPAHAPSPPLPPWCAPRVAAPALMHPHLRSRHRRARPRSSRGSRGKNLETYQYTVNNNNYEDGESLPAAVFSYDVSPMQAASRPHHAAADTRRHPLHHRAFRLRHRLGFKPCRHRFLLPRATARARVRR